MALKLHRFSYQPLAAGAQAEQQSLDAIQQAHGELHCRPDQATSPNCNVRFSTTVEDLSIRLLAPHRVYRQQYIKLHTLGQVAQYDAEPAYQTDAHHDNAGSEACPCNCIGGGQAARTHAESVRVLPMIAYVHDTAQL